MTCFSCTDELLFKHDANPHTIKRPIPSIYDFYKLSTSLANHTWWSSRFLLRRRKVNEEEVFTVTVKGRDPSHHEAFVKLKSANSNKIEQAINVKPYLSSSHYGDYCSRITISISVWRDQGPKNLVRRRLTSASKLTDCTSGIIWGRKEILTFQRSLKAKEGQSICIIRTLWILYMDG